MARGEEDPFLAHVGQLENSHHSINMAGRALDRTAPWPVTIRGARGVVEPLTAAARRRRGRAPAARILPPGACGEKNAVAP